MFHWKRSKTVIKYYIIIFLIVTGCSKENNLPTVGSVSTQRRGEIIAEFPIAEESFVYDAWRKRDPFVPLVGAEREKGTLAGFPLQGIFWDERKPMAIINDEVVKTGDTVAGAIVKEIRRDAVVVEYGGELFTLSLR